MSKDTTSADKGEENKKELNANDIDAWIKAGASPDITPPDLFEPKYPPPPEP